MPGYYNDQTSPFVICLSYQHVQPKLIPLQIFVKCSILQLLRSIFRYHIIEWNKYERELRHKVMYFFSLLGFFSLSFIVNFIFFSSPTFLHFKVIFILGSSHYHHQSIVILISLELICHSPDCRKTRSDRALPFLFVPRRNTKLMISLLDSTSKRAS